MVMKKAEFMVLAALVLVSILYAAVMTMALVKWSATTYENVQREQLIQQAKYGLSDDVTITRYVKWSSEGKRF